MWSRLEFGRLGDVRGRWEEEEVETGGVGRRGDLRV